MSKATTRLIDSRIEEPEDGRFEYCLLLVEIWTGVIAGEYRSPMLVGHSDSGY